MIVLLPATLGWQGANPVVLLAAKLASGATLAADLASGGVKGTLTLAPDGSLHIVAGDERLIHGPGGNWEFKAGEESYDYAGLPGPLKSGPYGTGRLAESARALLAWPLVGRALDPKGWTLRDGGYERTEGEASFRLEFDAGKRLTKSLYRTPMGGQAWTYTALRETAPAKGLFAPAIPTGFTEWLDPYLPELLSAGQALPVRIAPPVAGRPFLLAVLEAGSPPSMAAAEWLARLQEALPVVSLAERPVSAPRFRALEPGQREALRAMSSPTYILVSSQGKVLGVWLGYTKAGESAMEGEILAAAQTRGG